MAYRNMIETAQRIKGLWSQYKYLSCYDLSLDEAIELYDISKTDAVKAISIAFNYGFVLGTRANAKGRVSVL